MNTKTLKDESGNEVKISFPINAKYSLEQEVWFYLPNSLEVNKGRIVGMFVNMEGAADDSKRKYYYQVEYYKAQKDGTDKMFLGVVMDDEMSLDEKEIKDSFVNIRKERLEAAIRQGEIELGGAKATKEFHEKAEEEIKNELERLRNL